MLVVKPVCTDNVLCIHAAIQTQTPVQNIFNYTRHTRISLKLIDSSSLFWALSVSHHPSWIFIFTFDHCQQWARIYGLCQLKYRLSTDSTVLWMENLPALQLCTHLSRTFSSMTSWGGATFSRDSMRAQRQCRPFPVARVCGPSYQWNGSHGIFCGAGSSCIYETTEG